MSKIKMYRDQDDQNQGESWRWRLEDNGKAVVVSEACFGSKADLVDGIVCLCHDVLDEPSIIPDGSEDETGKSVRFVYRKGEDGKYDLRVDSKDGRTIARVIEKTTSEEEAVERCKSVREELKEGPPREFENPEDDDAHREKSEDRTHGRGIAGS